MKTSPSLAEEPVTPAKVLRRFRVIFKTVKTHFRQMEKQVGLGGAQVWALSIIKASPGVGMNEVAARMDIHQSTASNLIKTLLKKELISMERAVTDRRNVHLHILPQGSDILLEVSGPFEGVLPGALGSLSAETLCRLDSDLGQLIDLLDVDEAAANTPLAQM